MVMRPPSHSQKSPSGQQKGAPRRGAPGQQRQPATAASPPRKPSVVGQAVRFAVMPDFERSFDSVKGAWHLIVNMISQIFAMTNLISKNHPCLNLRNASNYKLLDIIAIAWRNLKWDRVHIPQIVMFFSVVAFLFFIALSLATLLLSLGVDAAKADSGTNGNDANQVLNDLFNLSGSGALPTAFGGMLAAYSNIILVLAGILLIYILINRVMESAQSGTPMGKNFNHTWTPIRLVVALGLLVPLSSGLNSGQYIVVYLAKWGSQMATQVLQRFTSYASMGEGITITPLTIQPQQALQNLFNLLACSYQQGGNPDNEIGTQLQNIQQPNATNPQTMSVNGCGSITFNYYQQASTLDQTLQNEQIKYFAGQIPGIATLAQAYVQQLNAQNQSASSHPNYYQGIQNSPLNSQFQQIISGYTSAVNTAIQGAVNTDNETLVGQLSSDLQSRGWIAAPMYFHRLVDANIRANTAAQAIPQVNLSAFDLGNGNDAIAGSTTSISGFTNVAEQGISQWTSQLSSYIVTAISLQVFNMPNPLISMVIAGRNLFVIASASMLSWTVLSAALGVGGTVGTNVVLAFGGFVTVVVTLIFASGAMLGYVMPMVPMFRFFFGVLGWIILVLIGVVGMPLFALAHLRTGGEGFVGQLQVQSAYNMLIGIIIRPTLIVIGMMLAMIIFKPMAHIAGDLFHGSLNDINQSIDSGEGNSVVGLPPASGAIGTLLGMVIIIQILADFMLALANACFKLIDLVP